MEIIAFDTDLTDGGFAPITWLSKHRIDNRGSESAFDYWSKTNLRTYLNETFLNSIPDIVFNNIL